MASFLENLEKYSGAKAIGGFLGKAMGAASDIIGSSQLGKGIGQALATPYINRTQKEITKADNVLQTKVINQLQNKNLSKESKDRLYKIYSQSTPIVSDNVKLTSNKEVIAGAVKLALMAAPAVKIGQAGKVFGAAKTGTLLKGSQMTADGFKALNNIRTASSAVTQADRVRKLGNIGRAINIADKYGVSAGIDFLGGAAFGIADATGRNLSLKDIKKEALMTGGLSAAFPLATGLALRGLNYTLRASGKGLSSVSNKAYEGLVKYSQGGTYEQRVKQYVDSGTDQVIAEIRALAEPAKTAGQKVAGFTAKQIDKVGRFYQNMFDRYKPLQSFGWEPYLKARLNDAQSAGEAELAAKEFSNKFINKYDSVMPEVKDRIMLMDRIDRAKRGDLSLVKRSVDELESAQGQHVGRMQDEGKEQMIQEAVDTWNDFNKQRLSELHEAGFLSDVEYAKIVDAHPNYVPHNVVIQAMDDSYAKFGVSGSLMPKKPIQEAVGGEYTMADPFVAYIERLPAHFKAIKNQGVVDAIINAGNFTALKTAEKVEARSALLGQMKELKKEANKLKSTLSVDKKYANQIKTKIRGLEKELENSRLEFENIFESYNAGATEKLPTISQALKLEKKDLLKEFDIENLKGNKLKSAQESIDMLTDKINAIKSQGKSYYDDIINELSATKISDKQLKESGIGKISRFVRGIKEDYLVPRDIEYAIKNLDNEQSGMVVNAVNAVNSLMKKFTTQYNLPFSLQNLARDKQTAFISANAFIKDAMKRLGLDEKSAKILNESSSEILTRYKKAGGYGSDIYSDGGGQAEKVLKMLKDKGFAKNLSSKLRPDKIIQEINTQFERNTRMQVFKKALQAGLPDEEAALIARDATVDFAKMGGTMRTLNKIIPFLNARVQGAINIGRVLKSDPEGVMRRIMWSAVYPELALHQHNRQFESFNNIPDLDRSNNWIIMTGEVDGIDDRDRKIKIPQYIKIRKGETQQLFTIPLMNFLDKMDGREPAKTGEMLTKILGSVSPISYGGYNNTGNPFDFLYAGISSLGPVGKIPVGLATNKDPYTGLDIIPANKVTGFDRSLQYKETTPDLIKRIGETLNVAPAQIEFLINSFGSVPRQIIGYADLATGGERKSTSGTTFGKLASDPLLNSFLDEGQYVGSKEYKADKETLNEISAKKVDQGLRRSERVKEILETAYALPEDQRKDYLYEQYKSIPADDQSALLSKYKARNAVGVLTPGMDKDVVVEYVWKEVNDMRAKNVSEDDVKEYLNTLYHEDIISKEGVKDMKGWLEYGKHIDLIADATDDRDKLNEIKAGLTSIYSDDNGGDEAAKKFLNELYREGLIGKGQIDMIKQIWNEIKGTVE